MTKETKTVNIHSLHGTIIAEVETGRILQSPEPLSYITGIDVDEYVKRKGAIPNSIDLLEVSVFTKAGYAPVEIHLGVRHD